MRHFDSTLERIGVHREAMILRGDFHFARREIHDRLIAAMMAEFKLVSFAAEGKPHNLMAEANAEDRFFADQFFYIFLGVEYRVGITGAVGKKDSVRVEREDIFRRRRGRN